MIHITNDGKKKQQSFEAVMDINFMTTMGDGNAVIRGYGADEAEARKELKLAWERLQVEYGKHQNETINS